MDREKIVGTLTDLANLLESDFDERGVSYRAIAIRAAITALQGPEVTDWLDNNMTYFDVVPPVEEALNVPALASVSKRIWYHATDNQDSYPFSEVIKATLTAAPKETP